MFAPGVITGPPTFSPDGNTVYFTRKRTIMVSHRRGDEWSDPEVAPFSGTWGDADPAMAPDGSFLIFASNRPASEPGDPLDGEWGTPERKVFKGQGGNLWRVDRAGDHWGPPRRLPDAVNRGTAVFEPSVVADGSLYFMDAHLPGNFRLYRSQLRDGRYGEPVQLPFTDGTSSDWDLTVAPDESFLVFASDRAPVPADHGDDLFLVRRIAGTWGPVAHLGPGVNHPDTGSVKPRLGPDGHTLYFLSDRPVSGAPPSAAGGPPVFHIWHVDLALSLNAAR
ncbi:MAG TPA: hypothetical protein VHW23_13315 [Kofleriaceae bacterium]|nr:hypothetical protein [Kofleriaceae bacterium]